MDITFLREIWLIFGLSDGAFYRRIKQGNKLLAGLPTTPTGRPPLFTDDQIEIIWQEVKRSRGLGIVGMGEPPI